VIHLTTKQREDWRDLCGRASPGPWEASTVEDIGGGSIYCDIDSPFPQNKVIVLSGRWDNGDTMPIHRPIYERECDANTMFAARARTAVPALLDENEEMRGVIARLLAWINSEEVAGIVQIATMHGRGLNVNSKACREGHQACRDAKALLEEP